MTKLSSKLIAFLGVLGAVAACGEAGAPDESLGTADVVAYVDTDASGNLSANDEMLSGVTVTLYDGESVVGTSVTNANGHAFFEDLPPGSYRVELADGPAGAALVTNPSPSAVIPVQGDTTAVEFRFVYFPGTVNGVIYRDDDADGQLDPSDTRGAGLWVWLRSDANGAMGARIDSVRTDAAGVYAFDRLAPGAYWLEFEQPTTISYGASGTTRRVVVAPQATLSENATYTGSLLLTIDEARDRNVGSLVTVRGNVTVPSGVFTSGTGGVNSEIWIQDATGGIAVFFQPLPAGTTYSLGQQLEVTGTLGDFSGQKQITSPTVTVLSGTQTVNPVGVTGAQVAARTHEGKLVTASSLTVVSVGGGTSPAFNVVTTDAAGATVTIRVSGANTGLTRSSFVVGQTYTITGVQSVFISGTGTVTPQIKPRFSTDVVLQTAAPGLVVITEIMPNPAAVSDNNGEFFEIYNAGGTAVNLNGWTFVDASTSATPHTITGLTIQPGDYMVFGLDANSATNGGMTVDQQYAGIFLNNSGGDRIVLKDASGATVDSVAFTGSPPTGASWGVIDPTADNSNINGTNWQVQTSVYGAGDRGTPNARNDNQVGPTAPLAGTGPFMDNRRTVRR